MKKKIKIIIGFIIILIVIAKLAFKYGIKIDTYNTIGSTVTVSRLGRFETTEKISILSCF